MKFRVKFLSTFLIISFLWQEIVWARLEIMSYLRPGAVRERNDEDLELVGGTRPKKKNSYPSYTDKQHFAREFTIPSSQRSDKSVAEIIKHELPYAIETLRRISELRQWMDESIAASRPLILWQNMRLGELYPYFTGFLKERMKIIDITSEQLGEFSKKPIPQEMLSTRYILVKHKHPSIPSILFDYESLGKFLENLAQFSNAFRAPVVMIDSSKQRFSGAQTWVTGQMAYGLAAPLWVAFSRDYLWELSDSKTFQEQLVKNSFLVLLNSTPDLTGYWMDDSVFMNLSEKELDTE